MGWKVHDNNQQPTRKRPLVFSVLGLFIIAIAGWFLFNTIANPENSPASYRYDIAQNITTEVAYYDSSFYPENPGYNNTAYVSNLTRDLTAYFDYSYKASAEINLTRTYEANAQIQATYAIKNNAAGETDSNVWTKDFQLVAPTTEQVTAAHINDKTKVVIPYADYKRVAAEFSNALALPTTNRVVVTYTTRIHGTVDGTDFEDKRVSTVTLALDDKIYQPVTHVDKTDTKQVINEDMKAAQSFATTIKQLAAAVSILAGIGLVLLGLRRQIFKTPYQRELEKIYRYHNGIIIRTTRQLDKTQREVVPVASFNDILDLEEELKLPIISSELSTRATAFAIIHEDIIYQYVLGDKTTDENTPPTKPSKPNHTETTPKRPLSSPPTIRKIPVLPSSNVSRHPATTEPDPEIITDTLPVTPAEPPADNGQNILDIEREPDVKDQIELNIEPASDEEIPARFIVDDIKAANDQLEKNLLATPAHSPHTKSAKSSGKKSKKTVVKPRRPLASTSSIISTHETAPSFDDVVDDITQKQTLKHKK